MRHTTRHQSPLPVRRVTRLAPLRALRPDRTKQLPAPSHFRLESQSPSDRDSEIHWCPEDAASVSALLPSPKPHFVGRFRAGTLKFLGSGSFQIHFLALLVTPHVSRGISIRCTGSRGQWTMVGLLGPLASTAAARIRRIPGPLLRHTI